MVPMVWVIDDDASIRFVFDRGLALQHISHRLFDSGEEALAALAREVPDVIVSDIRMPGISGLDLIARVRAVDDAIPFIIITAHSDLNAAVASYEHGVFEYLPKPFDINTAIAVIRRAINHRLTLLRQRERPPAEENPGQEVPESADPGEHLLGKSAAIQEVFKFIGRMARSELPILVNGEPGTGRSLIAQALHQHSGRADAPYVALNLTSMPPEQAELELFGSAAPQKSGALERASGGTLFLSEISSLSPGAQTRLLNVLREGHYVPGGATSPQSCNVRMVVSSSRNLEELSSQGLFLPDLCYHLNVATVSMPPLRERSGDIPLLTKHFLNEAAQQAHTEPKRLTSEVLVFLCRQSWPGNVRQLKNLCRYLTVMVSSRDIQLPDLPQELLHGRPASTTGTAPAVQTWQELLRVWAETRLKSGQSDLLSEAVPIFERVLLETTLDFTGRRKQEAARLLGWGRNTLSRKLKELRMSAVESDEEE